MKPAIEVQALHRKERAGLSADVTVYMETPFIWVDCCKTRCMECCMGGVRVVQEWWGISRRL